MNPSRKFFGTDLLAGRNTEGKVDDIPRSRVLLGVAVAMFEHMMDVGASCRSTVHLRREQAAVGDNTHTSSQKIPEALRRTVAPF